MNRRSVEPIENIRPFVHEKVTVKETGNIIEIRYMTKVQPSQTVQKLDANNYVILSTGEVKEYRKSENRADNLQGVTQSMRNLRDIINTNVTMPKRCRWITLTYAENMRDPKQLYNDFRKFNMRFKSYCFRQDLPSYEYITTAEPQARGAWHMHLLLIFEDTAPFIDNDVLSEIWGHGFTKTKSLQNIDNIGLYLTAYLTDMEFVEAFGMVQIGDKVILKEVKGRDGEPSKAIIKGQRLKLYPPHFRFYRCSRGIKRPIIINCTEQHAMKLVGDTPLSYEKTIQINDVDGNSVNTINYRQFNKKKKA